MSTGSPLKEPVASQLKDMANDVTGKSGKLLNRISDRLKCVTREESSLNDEKPPMITQAQWPAYFDDLRNEINAISRNITAIDKIIDRLEI